MQKIRVSLANCYGIGALTYEFDFTDSVAYSVYAPNGFMKTSFLKTLLDVSQGRPAQDRYFQRESSAEITDQGGVPIPKERIYAVPSADESSRTAPSSRLLVNEAVKARYDEAVRQTESKKAILLDSLKSPSRLSGRTRTVEAELLGCFGGEDLLALLESLVGRVPQCVEERLIELDCGRLFSDEALSLLESGEIGSQLTEYIATFNELVEKSPILNRQFNHYHAATVQQSLSANGFFDAKHAVKLNDGADGQMIESIEALEATLQKERARVLSDSALKQKFDGIEKKLSRKGLRDFRDYLAENQDIIPRLADFRDLRQEMWLTYLSLNREPYDQCVAEYRASRAVIREAIKTAKSERTEWEAIVDTFNRRFDVPFEVRVVNREEVILRETSPQVAFRFKDRDGEQCEVEEEKLRNGLSQGEGRALHLLSALFEIQVRTHSDTATVLVFDDIADSFDYKNKYAIIEYLCDICRSEKFLLILLTHNFDFHRTVSSRIPIPRSHRLQAVRDGRILDFAQEKYQRNTPFHHWRENLQEPSFVVASIPFVRNLAEYCGCATEYLQLTNLLHVREGTDTTTIRELEGIFQSVLRDKPVIDLPNRDRPVIELVRGTAEQLAGETGEHAELESKIVLSIAARLGAERYMIAKIDDPEWVKAIDGHQTRTLSARYRKDFPDSPKLDLIERVALMTPEGIHVNAFMYEPILDMCPGELRGLYTEVRDQLVVTEHERAGLVATSDGDES